MQQETSGYEGFFHLHTIQGEVEKTTLEYIIRDHDMELFQQRKKHFEKVATDLNRKWEQNLVQVEIKDQYFNF